MSIEKIAEEAVKVNDVCIIFRHYKNQMPYEENVTFLHNGKILILYK